MTRPLCTHERCDCGPMPAANASVPPGTGAPQAHSVAELLAALDGMRSRAEAAERLTEALSDALTEMTHDHKRPPMDMAWAARHANGVTDPCWFCGGMPSTSAHRTPARVLADLEASDG